MKKLLDSLSLLKKIILLLGPILFIGLSAIEQEVMGDEAWKVMALAIWMLLWWITEVIPIALTSLLPLIVLPFFDSGSIVEASSPYASPYVFLFLGGFILSLGMEKWNLHERIALKILNKTGSSGRRIILGFMIATAFLSMWISNTATTVMMLPIGMSVLSYLPSDDSKNTKNFALCLFLGIAYAANIGGISTLIGTPPNAVLAQEMTSFGIEIDFLSWMIFATPLSVILLIICFYLLTRKIYPIHFPRLSEMEEMFREKQKSLLKMKGEEKMVLVVFVLAAFLWMTKQLYQPLLGIKIHDASIGLIAGMSLFILPSKGKIGLLHWKDTRRLPWGILILFGGGLSLASAFKRSGLVDYLAEAFSTMQGFSLFSLMLILAFSALFLTEMMSNLALVSVMIPVVGALGLSTGNSPLYLSVPVTIAASCAFMLPMATPPNAIVFGSGKIRIPEMMKAGFVLNIVACIVVAAFCYLLNCLHWPL